MKGLLLCSLACLIGFGCAPKPEPQASSQTAPTSTPQTGAGTSAAPAGVGSSGAGNIVPIGPNAGGITPVAGGEDIGGGGGGGIGQAAKNQARKAAGQSVPTTTGDEGQ